MLITPDNKYLIHNNIFGDGSMLQMPNNFLGAQSQYVFWLEPQAKKWEERGVDIFLVKIFFNKFVLNDSEGKVMYII